MFLQYHNIIYNANVERVFSLMDIQWIDERNRFQLDTVEVL